jgi:hypothetical protein
MILLAIDYLHQFVVGHVLILLSVTSVGMGVQCHAFPPATCIKLRTQLSPVHRFTFSAAIAGGTPPDDDAGANGAITEKHSSAIAGVANSSSSVTISERAIVSSSRFVRFH